MYTTQQLKIRQQKGVKKGQISRCLATEKLIKIMQSAFTDCKQLKIMQQKGEITMSKLKLVIRSASAQ
jgi:hypothetical protein